MQRYCIINHHVVQAGSLHYVFLLNEHPPVVDDPFGHQQHEAANK